MFFFCSLSVVVLIHIWIMKRIQLSNVGLNSARPAVYLGPVAVKTCL